MAVKLTLKAHPDKFEGFRLKKLIKAVAKPHFLPSKVLEQANAVLRFAADFELRYPQLKNI